ncbi:MAG TPA: MBL fold metallo-hydrolase [Polyangia bacterium]|nr:MBL fold metallo-hydrolase [Polyangia bacterium]
MLTLGDAKLTMLNGGNFRLDGGAMHGVVPKTLWSKLVSCDSQNRCEYTTRCLLVETGGKRVLVETGNGDKFSPKLKEIYGIDHDRSIGDALREVGVESESIDVVIMTHLHFDHSGGTTRRTPAGRLEPVFPRARHVVQAREWRDATHPHERNRASYLQDSVAPLGDSGLLQIVDGEAEVAPDVRVVPTPGHTDGHQSVLVGAPDGPKALFLGDVVPTAVHTRLPWVMAYDLEPARTLETKRNLFARAIAEDWLLLWGHDRDHHGGRITPDKDGNPVVKEFVAV